MLKNGDTIPNDKAFEDEVHQILKLLSNSQNDQPCCARQPFAVTRCGVKCYISGKGFLKLSGWKMARDGSVTQWDFNFDASFFLKEISVKGPLRCKWTFILLNYVKCPLKCEMWVHRRKQFPHIETPSKGSAQTEWVAHWQVRIKKITPFLMQYSAEILGRCNAPSHERNAHFQMALNDTLTERLGSVGIAWQAPCHCETTTGPLCQHSSVYIQPQTKYCSVSLSFYTVSPYLHILSTCVAKCVTSVSLFNFWNHELYEVISDLFQTSVPS